MMNYKEIHNKIENTWETLKKPILKTGKKVTTGLAAILLSTTLLGACQGGPIEPDCPNWYEIPKEDIEMIRKEVKTLDDLNNFINSKIKSNYIFRPTNCYLAKDIVKNWIGDCTERAIVFLALSHYLFGIDGQLWLGTTTNEKGERKRHSEPYLGNIPYTQVTNGITFYWVDNFEIDEKEGKFDFYKIRYLNDFK